ETELKFDATETKIHLEDLAEELDIEAVEPEVSLRQGAVGEFVVAEGVEGRSVDIDALYASLVEKVEQGDFEPITIPFTVTQPTKTKAEVEENLVLRGVGTTRFTGTANRIHNLNKAVGIINGELGYYKLAPGAVFTTDDTLGDRTAANGWQKAGAYLNGTVTQDYGGGICQVSSTLYNGVLKAGLEIVERSSHSMPVGYLNDRRGLDAAIDRHNLDMRFKNNTDHDIYVIGYINNSSAVISFYIYGAPLEDGVDEIVLSSYQTGTIQPGAEQIIEDPTKPVGYSEVQVPRRVGERWAAFRHYMKNGEEVKKEELRSTTYRAFAGRRVVGTMVVETPTPEPTDQTQPTAPDQPTDQPQPTAPEVMEDP
ncbi:MAG: VanW family protein, partial [Christensenellales bacterium]